MNYFNNKASALNTKAEALSIFLNLNISKLVVIQTTGTNRA